MTVPHVIGWPAFKTADANPYQALLYEAVQQAGTPVVECTLRALLTAPRGTVLHLHWPDAFIANAPLPRAVIKLFALRLLAFWSVLRGIAWVWTAHNLQRPTQRHAWLLDQAFWPWFAKTLSGILYLTEASRHAAEHRFPHLATIPSAITPHGIYPVAMPTSPPTNRTELLFFGGVSPYKRVGDLIRAFVALDAADVHLRIAGASSAAHRDHDATAALAELPAHLRTNVTREDHFLSPEDLAARVHAAKLVVLPFVAVQNSGSVLYALSCGRPILVPDLPVFRDLRAQAGADWVHLFDGTLTAADLSTTLSALRTNADEKPDLSAFAWPEIGAQTAAFFTRVTR